MTTRIRFFGTENNLTRWRDLVSHSIGKTGSKITKSRRRNFCCQYDIELTSAERVTLQQHLRSENGEISPINNRPLQWNDCIVFEIRK